MGRSPLFYNAAKNDDFINVMRALFELKQEEARASGSNFYRLFLILSVSNGWDEGSPSVLHNVAKSKQMPDLLKFFLEQFEIAKIDLIGLTYCVEACKLFTSEIPNRIYGNSVSSLVILIEAGDFEKTIDVLISFSKKSDQHLAPVQKIIFSLLCQDMCTKSYKGMHLLAVNGFLTKELIIKLIDNKIIGTGELEKLLKAKDYANNTPLHCVPSLCKAVFDIFATQRKNKEILKTKLKELCLEPISNNAKARGNYIKLIKKGKRTSKEGCST